MKTLIDLFPVVVFFLAYKLFDLRVATLVLMVATVVQIALVLVTQKKLEAMHYITLGVVLLLGTATLLFKDERFIKWKPTAIYWLFAIIMFVSKYFGNKKPLLINILQSKKVQENVIIGESKLNAINFIAIIFFFALGFVNLGVAYLFSTNVWISFKLIGMPIILVLFTFIIYTTMLKKEFFEATERQKKD